MTADEFPLLVLVGSFALQVLTTVAGDAARKRSSNVRDAQTDAALLLSSTLMLLYLIVGFCFSMAINRYDLRKNAENNEALAIAAEYSRADLLKPEHKAKVQALLRDYLEMRIASYLTSSDDSAADSRELQQKVWPVVRAAITEMPPPLPELMITGMNDVMNAQGASRGAFSDRIPAPVWALMIAIAAGCCWVIGLRARRTDWFAFMIVPISASVSFFLIADLDSPHGGAIRVAPQNLTSLSQTLSAR